jgi:hypothetical protein
MGIHVEVTRKGNGLEELQKRMKEIREQKPYVKVGVIGRPAQDVHPNVEHVGRTAVMHPGTMTNVQLAIIHEFGSPAAGIPERSFIRDPFRAHRPEYREMLAKLIKAMLHGKMPVERGFGILGQRISADMKKWFTNADNSWMGNSLETVQRKGSSRPLIDRGILRNSISYAVEFENGGSAPAAPAGGEGDEG